MDNQQISVQYSPVKGASLAIRDESKDYKVKKRRQRAFSVFSVIALFLLFTWPLSVSNHGLKIAWHWPSTNRVDEQVVRRYNLTVGPQWVNLDGGWWRPIFVCNGRSPCETLQATEGDIVEINVRNDLFAQLSIHWSGMGHRKYGFWNDGTGGLNQYPILPRGNFTTTYDTTGHWGVNWYADHSGTGIIDGAHGLFYVTPSPDRPRPYRLLAKSQTDLQLIHEAERDIQHMILWNYHHQTTDWRILEMRATGKSMNCYHSILVNSKGRRMCRHPDYTNIDNQPLDESGCLLEPGLEPESCEPTQSDLEVFETHGKPYVMLNVLNIGFEHALQFSVDDHKIWIIATDGGFVEPELVDVLYITNGQRFTILIETNSEAADYAIRLTSTSKYQHLQGHAILRYPWKRYPLIGAPMEIPDPISGREICVKPDATVLSTCKETSMKNLKPYPASNVPQSNKTIFFETGQQASRYEEGVTEYYLNKKPWQLFHAQMAPVLFTPNVTHPDEPIKGGLPYGTVVDLIITNTINDTMPLYKHGDPTYLLGSGLGRFKYKSVREAIEAGEDINVRNPPMSLQHDAPALGWLAIRWQIKVRGATMIHSNKLKYYALGMAAPLLEGMDADTKNHVPSYAMQLPHVEFEPGNDGIFG